MIEVISGSTYWLSTVDNQDLSRDVLRVAYDTTLFFMLFCCQHLCYHHLIKVEKHEICEIHIYLLNLIRKTLYIS